MNRRQKIIVSITGIFLVLLILVGLTYAYFLTRIQGNTNSKSISATLADLEVTYQEDSAEVIKGEKITPGATFEKTFSVRNTGDADANFSIILDNIENNFYRLTDWTYKLYNGTSASGDPIVSGIVSRNEKQTIKSYETVKNSATNDYTLVVTYENVNEDQSIDMKKNLSLRVNIDTAKGTELVNAEEGTLLHAIGRDNNVTEPLTMPLKEVSGHYKGAMGDTVKEMSISSTYLNYYWTYADGYEYDTRTGEYTLINVHTGKYSEIYSQLVGKYLISSGAYSNSSSKDEQKTTSNLSIIYQVVSAESNKLTYKTGRKEFNEAELSYTEDDYGTSYYYRGNVEDNYVQFAGMCWRIVRVQGDGSIKLILAAEKECSSANLTESSGFATNGAKGEVGYTIEPGYGSKYSNGAYALDYVGDSNGAKAELDEWLERKIGEEDPNYAKLKEDNWCIGDLKNAYSDGQIVGTVNDLISKGTNFYYSAGNRFNYLKTPKIKCETTGTEGEIDKDRVGMLTMDEVAFAGGGEYSNSNYYLNKNATTDKWWTLSPSESRNVSDIYGFMVDSGSIYGEGYIGYSCDSIRPTVSIKPNIAISSGDGTLESPYIIE